jgi:hypothetical protein
MHLDNHAALTSKDSPTDLHRPISDTAALAVRHSIWYHRCSAPLAVAAGLKEDKIAHSQRI